MTLKKFFTAPGNLSKIATVIVLLALIRCISEPLRLQYYSPSTVTYSEIAPYLIGAMIAAVSLFAMTLLSYFRKDKFMVAMGVLTVLALLVVKALYL